MQKIMILYDNIRLWNTWRNLELKENVLKDNNLSDRREGRENVMYKARGVRAKMRAIFRIREVRARHAVRAESPVCPRASHLGPPWKRETNCSIKTRPARASTCGNHRARHGVLSGPRSERSDSELTDWLVVYLRCTGRVVSKVMYPPTYPLPRMRREESRKGRERWREKERRSTHARAAAECLSVCGSKGLCVAVTYVLYMYI